MFSGDRLPFEHHLCGAHTERKSRGNARDSQQPSTAVIKRETREYSCKFTGNEIFATITDCAMLISVCPLMQAVICVGQFRCGLSLGGRVEVAICASMLIRDRGVPIWVEKAPRGHKEKQSRFLLG